MKIRTWPKDQKTLRGCALPVENVNDSRVQRFIDRMLKTMRRYGGAGLAANQVGVLQRIILVGKQVIINPVIEQGNPNSPVPYITYSIADESCLSLPGVTIKIERKASVHITGMNRHGKPLDFHATGDLARCIQHEIDHLNGDLIIDGHSKDE